MFHRLFLAILTVFVFFSCTTTGGQVAASGDEDRAAEPVIPVLATEENADQELKADESAEPEAVLFKTLLWSTPSDFNIVLDKKTPLPFVKARKKPVKNVISRPVQEDIDAVSSVTDTAAEAEPETVVEPETHSFLEPLFSSGGTEAADVDDVADEERPEPAEAHIEDVPVIKTETSPAEPVSISEYATGAVREVFVLECDAEGWLLDEVTGFEGTDADGLRYNGRNYAGGKTFFSFYPYNSGIYIIKLSKPDFSAGITLRKIVKLEVVSYHGTEKDAETDVSGELPAAAVAEVVDEEQEAAADEGVSSSVQPAEGSAADGLYDAAGIIAAAAALETAGDCVGAASLIEDCIETAAPAELDSLYFRLGGLYENCAGIRDEKAAIAFYKKIVDYYPVSNYWIDAKERIIYLERNFIYIR